MATVSEDLNAFLLDRIARCELISAKVLSEERSFQESLSNVIPFQRPMQHAPVAPAPDHEPPAHLDAIGRIEWWLDDITASLDRLEERQHARAREMGITLPTRLRLVAPPLPPLSTLLKESS